VNRTLLSEPPWGGAPVTETLRGGCTKLTAIRADLTIRSYFDELSHSGGRRYIMIDLKIANHSDADASCARWSGFARFGQTRHAEPSHTGADLVSKSRSCDSRRVRNN
jgi:hypothetical protein